MYDTIREIAKRSCCPDTRVGWGQLAAHSQLSLWLLFLFLYLAHFLNSKLNKWVGINGNSFFSLLYELCQDNHCGELPSDAEEAVCTAFSDWALVGISATAPFKDMSSLSHFGTCKFSRLLGKTIFSRWKWRCGSFVLFSHLSFSIIAMYSRFIWGAWKSHQKENNKKVLTTHIKLKI